MCKDSNNAAGDLAKDQAANNAAGDLAKDQAVTGVCVCIFSPCSSEAHT